MKLKNNLIVKLVKLIMGLSSKLAAMEDGKTFEPVTPVPIVNAVPVQSVSSPISMVQNFFSNGNSNSNSRVNNQTFNQIEIPENLKQMNYFGAIKGKIDNIIRAKELYRFYSGQSYIEALRRALSINYENVSKEFNVNLEIATDLCSISLYDVIVIADNSGSMSQYYPNESKNERKNDLEMILSTITKVSTLFDDDGISVQFLNNLPRKDNITSDADVETMMKQVSYGGGTPIGSRIKEIVNTFVNDRMKKPIVIYIITDGVPDSEPDVRNVMRQIKDKSDKMNATAVSIMFCQVGKDKSAESFLKDLDDDSHVGDFIDTIKNYEAEETRFKKQGIMGYTPYIWLIQMLVGAIDPSYDDNN